MGKGSKYQTKVIYVAYIKGDKVETRELNVILESKERYQLDKVYRDEGQVIAGFIVRKALMDQLQLPYRVFSKTPEAAVRLLKWNLMDIVKTHYAEAHKLEAIIKN